MTDLGLANAVDAAEALFQTVRVPRQVVVHHQVCALEVNALTGGVRGQQDQNVLVLLEALLRLGAVLAAHATVHGDNRLGGTQQCSQLFREVIERIAMLSEEDQLAPVAMRVEHFGLVLQER